MGAPLTLWAGRSFVVCLICRGPPTIYSYHKRPSSASVAELEMWSHVVRRHMWRQSSTHPSQAVAHFFHLRPVVTANILLSNTVLSRQ